MPAVDARVRSGYVPAHSSVIAAPRAPPSTAARSRNRAHRGSSHIRSRFDQIPGTRPRVDLFGVQPIPSRPPEGRGAAACPIRPAERIAPMGAPTRRSCRQRPETRAHRSRPPRPHLTARLTPLPNHRRRPWTSLRPRIPTTTTTILRLPLEPAPEAASGQRSVGGPGRLAGPPRRRVIPLDPPPRRRPAHPDRPRRGVRPVPDRLRPPRVQRVAPPPRGARPVPDRLRPPRVLRVAPPPRRLQVEPDRLRPVTGWGSGSAGRPDGRPCARVG